MLPLLASHGNLILRNGAGRARVVVVSKRAPACVGDEVRGVGWMDGRGVGVGVGERRVMLQCEVVNSKL